MQLSMSRREDRDLELLHLLDLALFGNRNGRDERFYFLILCFSDYSSSLVFSDISAAHHLDRLGGSGISFLSTVPDLA